MPKTKRKSWHRLMMLDRLRKQAKREGVNIYSSDGTITLPKLKNRRHHQRKNWDRMGKSFIQQDKAEPEGGTIHSSEASSEMPERRSSVRQRQLLEGIRKSGQHNQAERENGITHSVLGDDTVGMMNHDVPITELHISEDKNIINDIHHTGHDDDLKTECVSGDNGERNHSSMIDGTKGENICHGNSDSHDDTMKVRQSDIHDGRKIEYVTHSNSQIDGTTRNSKAAKKRHICLIRGKKFANLKGLRLHMRVHTKHVSHGDGNIGDSKSMGHNESSQNDVQWKNEQCSEGEMDDRNKTDEKNKERIYKCEYCTNTFKAKFHLISHQHMKHTELRPFECVICAQQYTSFEKYKEHFNAHKEWKCRICKKSYDRRASLQNHIKWMHSSGKRKSVQCPTCDQECANVLSLKLHQRSHNDLRTYECHICGKIFKKDNLRFHMRIHTGENPYKCSTCGANFSTRDFLKKHQSTHTREIPYNCRHCGRRFHKKQRLVKHERVHHGNKPSDRAFSSEHFSRSGERDARTCVCHVCGKIYKKQYLSRHMRIHTGEKPYNCSTCGANFRTYSCLELHKMTHTGEMPYSCRHCGRAFIKRQRLVTHELMHHGEEHPALAICREQFSRSGEREKNTEIRNDCDGDIANTSHVRHDDRNHIDETKEENIHRDKCDSHTDNMNVRQSDILDGMEKDITHSNIDVNDATSQVAKTHTCLICGENLANLHELQLHMRVHTMHMDNGDGNENDEEKKKRTCSICGKILATVLGVRIHMRVHTMHMDNGEENKGDEEEKRTCSICGKILATVLGVKYHMRVHKIPSSQGDGNMGDDETMGHHGSSQNDVDVKNNQCSEAEKDGCNKAEERKIVQLRKKKHVAARSYESHSRDLLCTCTICGKVSTIKGDIPSGQLPTKCSTCEEAHQRYFQGPTNLSYHMQSPSGGLLFTCTICGKVLTFQGDIPSGKLPTKCSICEKAYERFFPDRMSECVTPSHSNNGVHTTSSHGSHISGREMERLTDSNTDNADEMERITDSNTDNADDVTLPHQSIVDGIKNECDNDYSTTHSAQSYVDGVKIECVTPANNDNHDDIMFSPQSHVDWMKFECVTPDNNDNDGDSMISHQSQVDGMKIECVTPDNSDNNDDLTLSHQNHVDEMKGECVASGKSDNDDDPTNSHQSQVDGMKIECVTPDNSENDDDIRISHQNHVDEMKDECVATGNSDNDGDNTLHNQSHVDGMKIPLLITHSKSDNNGDVTNSHQGCVGGMKIPFLNTLSNSNNDVVTANSHQNYGPGMMIPVSMTPRNSHIDVVTTSFHQIYGPGLNMPLFITHNNIQGYGDTANSAENHGDGIKGANDNKSKQTKKKHTCSICGRILANKTRLGTHMRIHTGEKPYTCPICGSNFRTYDAFKNHRIRHDGIKPYKCHYCDRGFSAKCHLVKHERLHDGEKPLECAVCRKQFTSSMDYHKHMKSHK